ncbi:helix-turn-helix transcriptional regulator [Methylomicrobium sp. Wu6]|uniref:helix-turn-helix transcriptional regulator n=1 Tax=Methylomicrobium sp. Wu6 TaxID=3107928 RepID=UPI002DD61A20|nr:helix-turn-helix transcriptional regulator [Methylomicrobium sp. Wu6]MEC4747921.1 helix-turn-helix transcriptional regulator [Methylomicrobium sp. Wu6]
MTGSHPRRLLGSFIRAHREHLPVPTKAMGRRRTPGWRREELADAAGVSVTWLTWLEQGRDVKASVAALTRLAEALQLMPAERASLFDLAGKRDPAGAVEPRTELLPELLNLPSLFKGPAYLIDRNWTARTWNNEATQLFIGWLDTASTERNLLKFVFLNPDAQRLIIDWSERVRRLVAEFRADYSRRPQDSNMQALIDELLAKSQEFSHYWREQAVLNREGGERCFNHPLQGELIYLQTTLIVALQPDCKLVCLIPLKEK